MQLVTGRAKLLQTSGCKRDASGFLSLTSSFKVFFNEPNTRPAQPFNLVCRAHHFRITSKARTVPAENTAYFRGPFLMPGDAQTTFEGEGTSCSRKTCS